VSDELLGLATVKLSDVDPFSGIVAVTGPVVFVKLPEAAPVTAITSWHWLLTAMVAPGKTIPVGAVMVSVPPQTVAEAFATVIPAGSVSEKATPVRAAVFPNR
jgi:hypothetical protein